MLDWNAERAQELANVRDWAAAALDEETAVVLDTETTGRDESARVVEVAVLTVGGEVLLDQLINPGIPIPPAATAVHGITDEMVRDAPTFGDVLVQLTGALMHRVGDTARSHLVPRRVLVYNAPFDRGRLRWELVQHYRAAGHADAEASADGWLQMVLWDDVMEPYAVHVGDWSDYHGNYRWPRLGGGHRAAGDCRTVLDRLAEMAGRAGAGGRIAGQKRAEAAAEGVR